jgi:hypothetical protein
VADGSYLILRPDSDGEGAGAAAQDRVGAVVERLKGWNQAAPTNPDEGAESTLAGSSLVRSVLELCLGKEGAETCKVLEKILTMVSTENSSFCKNYLARQFVH